MRVDTRYRAVTNAMLPAFIGIFAIYTSAKTAMMPKQSDIFISTDRYSYWAHGVTMLSVWLVAVPIGVAIPRYFKVTDWSIARHRIFVGAGVYGTVGFAVAGLAAGSFHILTRHGQFGLFIAFGVAFQVLIGIVSLKSQQSDENRQTRILITKEFHKITSYGLHCVALYNARVGLDLITSGMSYHQPALILFSVWCWILFFAFTAMDLTSMYVEYVVENPEGISFWDWLKFRCEMLFKSPDAEREASIKLYKVPEHLFNSLPPVTWADVGKHVSTGSMWVVIDETVFDIRDWIFHHPGGKAVLIQSIGMDISEIFKKGMHSHSAAAWKKLLSSATARIRSHINDESGINLSNGLNDRKLLIKRQHNVQFYGQLKLEHRKQVTFSDRVPVYLFTFRVLELQNRNMLPPGSSFAFHYIDSRTRHSIVERSYSPFYSGDYDEIHFLIKIYEYGSMSRYLLNLKIGDSIKVRPQLPTIPVHIDLSPSKPSTIAMIVCGTGITPMIRIIEHYGKQLHENRSHFAMKLLWLEKSPQELFDLNQFFDFPVENFLQIHKTLSEPPPDWYGFRSININVIAEFLELPIWDYSKQPSDGDNQVHITLSEEKAALLETKSDESPLPIIKKNSSSDDIAVSLDDIEMFPLQKDQRLESVKRIQCVFVCGPPQFCNVVETFLKKLGIASESIHVL